jgi:hypothetical protein
MQASIEMVLEAWPEQEPEQDLVGEYIFSLFPWNLHLAMPFSNFCWLFFQQVRKSGLWEPWLGALNGYLSLSFATVKTRGIPILDIHLLFEDYLCQ